MSDILLRFVHISDTHITHEPDYKNRIIPSHPGRLAEALVEQINHLPFTPDFVLHTGDVVLDKQPERYEVAREILGRIQVPVYYLAGNHDDSAMLQRIFLQRETVQEDFCYEFEANGVQVICLDSTGPAEWPRGSISDSQMDWLRGLLTAQDERPLVVGVHHNVLATGMPWLDDGMRLENGDTLHETLRLAGSRLRGVFYGHIHQNVQTWRDGIVYSSVLSSWYQLHSWPNEPEFTVEYGAEPGFNIVFVSADQTHVRHHRYGLPE